MPADQYLLFWSYTHDKNQYELIFNRRNEKDLVKYKPAYSNDTACAHFIRVIADTLKKKSP